MTPVICEIVVATKVISCNGVCCLTMVGIPTRIWTWNLLETLAGNEIDFSMSKKAILMCYGHIELPK